MADFESVQTLRKQIELDLGTVDILINNAGLIPFLSLREGTEREIQRIVEVNLTSNFYVSLLIFNWFCQSNCISLSWFYF